MDRHFGVIFQTIAGFGAVAFTALSWWWVRKTGGFIKTQATSMTEQTKAITKQADLNNDLLLLEINRDKQANKISAYIIAEVVPQVLAGRAFGQNRGYRVKVEAIIDNQSLQPVFEIVSILFKRKPHLMGKITLTAEDIPISVVGPKMTRTLDISDCFVRDHITIDKTAFEDSALAQHLAKQIEIEYIVLLSFRDAEGIYWARNAQSEKLEITTLPDAISKYENALSASIAKLQQQFTDRT